MTFKASLRVVTAWGTLAFVVVAMVVMGSACVASVERDSSEDVAEAQAALTACGVRGLCPTGTTCDYGALLCRPICSGSGTCNDQDDNPCTTGMCGHGMCNPVALADGTICQGRATDGIHGECVDGACNVQEWTCIHYPAGTACQGGICDAYQHCCTGCIASNGSCYQIGISGGGSCCSSNCDDGNPVTVDTCIVSNGSASCQHIGI